MFSLTLYRDGRTVNPQSTESQEVEAAVKTTMIIRNIANPRRTTLAHLKDADELQAAPEQPAADLTELPTNTANPRRTVLMEAPVAAVAE